MGLDFNTALSGASSAYGLSQSASRGDPLAIAGSSISVARSGIALLALPIPPITVPLAMAISTLLSVVQSFTSSGEAKKLSRTLQGTIQFQQACINILENGASAWFQYSPDELARLEQLTRPESMKPVFADPGNAISNTDINDFKRLAPYLPVVEAVAVLTNIQQGIYDYDSLMATVNSGGFGRVENVIMWKVKNILEANFQLVYPFSHDIARIIRDGYPGFTLFDYLGYIRYLCNLQSMQGVSEPVAAIGEGGIITTENLPNQTGQTEQKVSTAGFPAFGLAAIAGIFILGVRLVK